MWATSDRASMSRPSARVKRAQQVRQRHRLGMMQRSEMDESSVNVSATATIIGISLRGQPMPSAWGLRKGGDDEGTVCGGVVNWS